jgi:hypothetical protein
MIPNAKLSAVLFVSVFVLAGCYVVPVVDPQGNVQYQHYPLPPAGAPMAVSSTGYQTQGSPFPTVLNARLYPDNDLATHTGVVNGTVANMMNGKGRFQIQYSGEILTGEATRISNDERRGIASAYGSSGSYMSCEYQMVNPRQGAGACSFSNGARYKLHIGS